MRDMYVTSMAWDRFLLLLRLMGCIAGDVKVAKTGGMDGKS